jgi:hypothetical protein
MYCASIAYTDTEVVDLCSNEIIPCKLIITAASAHVYSQFRLLSGRREIIGLRRHPIKGVDATSHILIKLQRYSK